MDTGLDEINKKDITCKAMWSLSSAKSDHGIYQLLDESYDTYWQSDGSQPHYVNIEYNRKHLICEICLYISLKLDESYTPKKIIVRAGNHYDNLREIKTVVLDNPSGWVCISTADSHGNCLKTNMVQLEIVANHQNGRDTHLRRIKVNSPREDNRGQSLDFAGFSLLPDRVGF